MWIPTPPAAQSPKTTSKMMAKVKLRRRDERSWTKTPGDEIPGFIGKGGSRVSRKNARKKYIDKIIRDSEHCFDLNSPGEDLKLSSAKLLDKSLACLTTAVSMLPLPRNEAIATLWALLQSSPSFVYRIHKFQLLVQAKPINRTSTSHQYKSLLLIDELA